MRLADCLLVVSPLISAGASQSGLDLESLGNEGSSASGEFPDEPKAPGALLFLDDVEGAFDASETSPRGVEELKVATFSQKIDFVSLHQTGHIPMLASILAFGGAFLLVAVVFVGRRRHAKPTLVVVKEPFGRAEGTVRNYVRERRESTENTFLLPQYLKANGYGSTATQILINF
ncbi:hypothetical protein QR680_009267 [Steinernema hermaphroditum]|uniref:Uncharacterized protein n=1 Tax=Steinernema hermaphroditum TaxID=289476 RepID=A0AA39IJN4_9BILA|nr:hypothetical protein QR680_009267 [Steinernema hermaphroditum]